jgi:hypothetical protein
MGPICGHMMHWIACCGEVGMHWRGLSGTFGRAR